MKRLAVRLSVGMMSVVVALAAAGCLNVKEKLQEASQAVVQGDFKTGYEITGRILKKEKGNVPALILNGWCAYQGGKYDESLARLDEATRLAPEDYSANLYYGMVLSLAGRYEQALVPLRKAYQLRSLPRDQNLENLLILLARSCLEQHLEEGTRYLQALLVFDNMRGNPDVYNALGYLYTDLQKYDLARKSFDLAWRAAPESTLAPQNIAVLCDLYQKNPGEALRHYRFCAGQAVKNGDTSLATRIHDRILQLSREVPNAGTATVPAGAAKIAAGTAATSTAKTAAAKTASGTKGAATVKPSSTAGRIVPLKPATTSTAKSATRH